MTRTAMFLHSLLFLSVVIVTSCGSDKSTVATKSASGTSTLVGECSFTSEYFPVCGANTITYTNQKHASCYGVTQTVQGNCICTESPVCGDNNITYTECDAQAAIRNGEIKKIIKFSDCRY